MKRIWLALFLCLGIASQAQAQSNFKYPPLGGVSIAGVQVVASCGAGTLTTTQFAYLVVDTTGKLCTSAVVSATVSGTIATSPVVVTPVNCVNGCSTSTTATSENIVAVGNQTIGTSLPVIITQTLTVSCNFGCAGSGGGGAITAAAGSYAVGSIQAGADATEGTSADAAYAGSGSATLISAVKGLYNVINSSIPAGFAGIGSVSQQSSATIPWTVAEQNGLGYANHANWVNGSKIISSTSAVTLLPAPGSNRLYVTTLDCTRNDAGTTAISGTLNDPNSTVLDLPNNGGGGGNEPPLVPALIMSTTTALTITFATSVNAVHCHAEAYNAP